MSSRWSAVKIGAASFMIDNRQFADENKEFKMACDMAKIPPSKRQASKYRRGLGLAYRSVRVARMTDGVLHGRKELWQKMSQQ
jgi:hypothetical protein